MFDVIIIGSGPAGLTAAIYASRAELKTLVISGPKPGGQLVDTTEVENFPGFPDGVLGPELMDRMIKQSTRFGARLKQESVVGVDFKTRPFLVKTDKDSYSGKTVIIASGADAKWLGLPSEQRLRGHGVSACATCDGFFFKGKEVAVIGGGDAAMEESLFLTKFATKVTIIHRREEFRASKIMLRRAQNNLKISFIVNSEVVEVLGQDKVEGVKIKDKVSGKEQRLKVSGLFLAIGHKPATDFYVGQLELDQKGYIKVNNNTLTSVKGVFTAGDVNDYRYRQAITASGLGCMAAMDAEKWLSEQGEEN